MQKYIEKKTFIGILIIFELGMKKCPNNISDWGTHTVYCVRQRRKALSKLLFTNNQSVTPPRFT